MEPNRYVLRGKSLARLGVQALAEHGPRARIVSAERVRVGGIGGFMAREHYEAVVEVPSSGADPGQSPDQGQNSDQGQRPDEGDELSQDRAQGSPQDQSGAQRLRQEGSRDSGQEALREADSRRRRRAAAQRRAAPSDVEDEDELDEDFARLMDELWFASREPPSQLSPDPGLPQPQRAAPPAPAVSGVAAPEPLRAAGALVVVACLGTEQSAAVSAFGAGAGSGALGDPILLEEAQWSGRPLREARQLLLETRAQAVAMDVPVLATVSLKFPRPGVRSGAETPVVTEADQLWAAVDLRRKHEDTRRWLAVLDQSRPIDGLVLTWADETLSPESGQQLGWPVSVRMNRC